MPCPSVQWKSQEYPQQCLSHVSVTKARLTLFLSMNSCTSGILGAGDIASATIIFGAWQLELCGDPESREKSHIVFCRESAMGEWRFIIALLMKLQDEVSDWIFNVPGKEKCCSTLPLMAVFLGTEGFYDRIWLDWRLEVDKVTPERLCFCRPALHPRRVSVVLDIPWSTKQRQRPVDKRLGEVDDKIPVRNEHV